MGKFKAGSLFLLGLFIISIELLQFSSFSPASAISTTDQLSTALTSATISDRVPNAGAADFASSTAITTTTTAVSEDPVTPAPPVPTPAPTSKPQPAPITSPARVSIPSIALNAAIRYVGTDPDGSMSVPTAPNIVGWYKDGTVPGDIGSAVLAAHVYLAFKNLNRVKLGSSIYITGTNGVKLRFIVSDIELYQYTQVPAQKLFAAADAQHLNLITCAGKWLPAKGTYDHRLVVYATLEK